MFSVTLMSRSIESYLSHIFLSSQLQLQHNSLFLAMVFLPGLPEVTLTGMKADIKVHLQNLGNSVYRATYTPSVPGAYLLNVMWSDR